MVNLEIDNQDVEIQEGATVLEAAKKLGIRIPTLCHNDALTPYGACQLCTVEVEINGRKRMVASCLYPVGKEIKVSTSSERVKKARKIIIELLLARCPNVKILQDLAKEYGVEKVRFSQKNEDCILCGLCVRICTERLGIGAIGFEGRGTTRKVGIPFGLEESDVCVGCGACTYVCPTGAIQMETKTLNKFRQSFGINERKCRYMMMGVVDYKLCPNNYECWRCEVDQQMEETFGTHPALAVKKTAEKEPIKVEEFFIEPDLFYSLGHAWVKRIDGRLRIGLDDFARRLIGSIDNIKVKNINDEIKKGEDVWQLICGKRQAIMRAPIEGRVIDINTDILDNPKIISASPYRIGWIYTLEPYNLEEDIKKLLFGVRAKRYLIEHSNKLHQRLSSIGVTITDGGQIASALHQRLNDKEWQELINEFF